MSMAQWRARIMFVIEETGGAERRGVTRQSLHVSCHG